MVTASHHRATLLLLLLRDYDVDATPSGGAEKQLALSKRTSLTHSSVGVVIATLMRRQQQPLIRAASS